MLSDEEMSNGLPLLNDKLMRNKVVVEHQPDSHLYSFQFTVDISTLLWQKTAWQPGIPFFGAMVLTCSSQDVTCMDYFPYLPT